MRNSIIRLVLLMCTLGMHVQQGITYKAVIKDGASAVTFTHLDGISTAYMETHALTNNANGIVIVNINEGTSSTTLVDIHWRSNLHFLNVQTDDKEC